MKRVWAASTKWSLWDCTQLGHGFHIVPVDDWIEHVLTPDCICEPRVEDDGELFVHHAFDARPTANEDNEA